jgi:hypothetical protein
MWGNAINVVPFLKDELYLHEQTKSKKKTDNEDDVHGFNKFLHVYVGQTKVGARRKKLKQHKMTTYIMLNHIISLHVKCTTHGDEEVGMLSMVMLNRRKQHL